MRIFMKNIPQASLYPVKVVQVFNIVLYEPEIPQNTGNIARLCAVTGCRLHLVGPLGFSLENRYLRRAGLDYWDLLEVRCYDSFQELKEAHPSERFFYLTTRGKKWYTEVAFAPGDFFVFGKESEGLPDELLLANEDFTLRIPMLPHPAARCLNISNSVAIVVYEAFRQQMFKGLS